MTTGYTPVMDEKIAELVTADMRNAAIEYWKMLHPKEAAIPIGEINGIIYCALSASKVVQVILTGTL